MSRWLVVSSQSMNEEEVPTEELPEQQHGQIVPYVGPQQPFANVNWALEDLALSDVGGMVLPPRFTVDALVATAPNQLRIGPKRNGYIYTKRRPDVADLRPSYVCCKAADGWDAPAGFVLHLVPVRMRRGSEEKILWIARHGSRADSAKEALEKGHIVFGSSENARSSGDIDCTKRR